MSHLFSSNLSKLTDHTHVCLTPFGNQKWHNNKVFQEVGEAHSVKENWREIIAVRFWKLANRKVSSTWFSRLGKLNCKIAAGMPENNLVPAAPDPQEHRRSGTGSAKDFRKRWSLKIGRSCVCLAAEKLNCPRGLTVLDLYLYSEYSSKSPGKSSTEYCVAVFGGFSRAKAVTVYKKDTTIPLF